MQTRTASAIETVTSTAIGYGVSLLTQAIVFPLFGIQTTPKEHIGIAAVFTVVSLVRGYLVRRLFNWMGRTANVRDALEKELTALVGADGAD